MQSTCSNSVIVGVMGPMGSGLPQLGFPRLFAMYVTPRRGIGQTTRRCDDESSRFALPGQGFILNRLIAIRDSHNERYLTLEVRNCTTFAFDGQRR